MSDKDSIDLIQKENKMRVKPIKGLVLGMSFPPMISMLVGALYNIVESVFVARVSEDALTAVTLFFPAQMMLISVGVGTGVGLNSLIARRLGARKQDEANSAASHGFLCALINWIIFAVFGLFFVDDFLRLFTDDPFIFSSALIFGRIVTIGSLFVFISVTIERILQSTGNVLFPMIFNIVGAVLNMILAPTLILGLFGLPGYGVQGAGMAVVITQFMVMLIAIIMLFGFKHHVKVQLRGFRPRLRTLKDIYAVGVPSIVMMSVGSFMMAGLNAILLTFSPTKDLGETAVAILGIYYRINSFVFMPVFGLNQGAMPVIAFNFGAKQKSRLMEAYKFSLSIAVGIMLVGMAILLICAPQILHLFSATPDMYALGVPALRIFSLSFITAGFAVVTVSLFQALAHGFFSMFVSLLRQIILVLPLTYVLIVNFGVTSAWASFPIAEVLSSVLTVFLLRYVYKKEIKNL
ncbi:MAG: MATE family efflux transporter [Clostridiales Family XIII bacterium]|jgi:putative MATE family efflux protein|nr:MATE family efflux transporter [Clostridiales Family XIII bacterium]